MAATAMVLAAAAKTMAAIQVAAVVVAAVVAAVQVRALGGVRITVRDAKIPVRVMLRA